MRHRRFVADPETVNVRRVRGASGGRFDSMLPHIRSPSGPRVRLQDASCAGLRRRTTGSAGREGDHLSASSLSADAVAYADGGVTACDPHRRLAELMIDHNVGVTDRETYAVKRVDSDYFSDAELT